MMNLTPKEMAMKLFHNSINYNTFFELQQFNEAKSQAGNKAELVIEVLQDKKHLAKLDYWYKVLVCINESKLEEKR